MAEVVRFGVSIDAGLLANFDKLIAEKGYVNRSEAIRDLVRDRMVQAEWEQPDKEIAATVTIVFDHEVPELADRLTDFEHEHHSLIVASLHVHLDAHNCLEVLVLRGKSAEVKRLGEALISMKGVRHGKIATTTTGASLA